MKKLYFLGFGLVLSVAQINAQAIKNVQASISGSNVIISYDLTTLENGQKFNIELKSSKDGFKKPLKEATGDIGINQIAGTGKKITWNARKELGSFKGSISFKIIATVTFAPLKFVQPAAGSGIKIGKTYTIEWQGSTLNRSLKLELLKNNSQIIDMGNIKNTGSYAWSVPKNLEKGPHYQLKLFDPTKPNEAVLSAQFNLKKMPLLIYIGAGVVVVGVAAVLLGGNKKNPDENSGNPLPDPPKSPGG